MESVDMSVEFKLELTIKLDDLNQRYTIKGQLKDTIELLRKQEGGFNTSIAFLEQIRIRL
jgi:hypothetical protein